MSSHHQLIQKISAQAEKWDYELDRLQHRAKDLEGELEQEVKQVIEDIKLKRDGLKSRVAQLEEAAEDAVEEITEGLEIAWNILLVSFSDAKDRFTSEL